jgi:hypothetical protein
MSPLATGTDTTLEPRPEDNPSHDGQISAPRGTSHRRRGVFKRERDDYCGIKIGLAFFGWLTATGTAVMLTAFVAAATVAVSAATHLDASSARNHVAQDPKTMSIIGAAILLVVPFVAYYCGGYVTGRMARFNGVRQGVAVWLWALCITALVAVLAALALSHYDVLTKLNTLPRIPVSHGNLTAGGLIALAVLGVGSLGGAMLGGLAGMHFQRRIDQAVFES